MHKASSVLLPSLLALTALTAMAQDAPVTAAQKTAAKKITPELLRAHIRFLASDLLEGRGPATRGDQLAEAYIQSQMEGPGFKPRAAGGSRGSRSSASNAPRRIRPSSSPAQAC